MTALHIALPDAEATLALGRRIGGTCRGGEVFALCGPLGAGKTLLTRGLAAGLGVPPDDPIVSPTFVLVREYVAALAPDAGTAAPLRLFHLDAYRLASAEELLALGFADMCAADTVAVVEWADRARPALPADACWIELAYAGTGGEQRSAEIHAPGRAIMAALTQ